MSSKAISVAFAILTLVLMQVGCKGESVFVSLDIDRLVTIEATDLKSEIPSSTITGQAPLQIYVMPTVSMDGYTIGISSTVRSVEVNPGDGSGWVDVTSQWCDYQEIIATNAEIDSESDLIGLIYEQQGQFTVSARVTFKDDRLVTSSDVANQFQEPAIHVLPYPE